MLQTEAYAPHWAELVVLSIHGSAGSICCWVPVDLTGSIRGLDRANLLPWAGFGLFTGGWELETELWSKSVVKLPAPRMCMAAVAVKVEKGMFTALLQGFANPCAAFLLSVQGEGADLEEQWLLR